jgi:ATP-dependent RNA helicase RhlE
MTFENLNLLPQILVSLKAKGYNMPTPIQEKSIPPILEGRDICGSAQTGTGKTASFALPMLQMLFNNKAQQRKGIKALILAPTRELAQQISDSFRDYGKGLNLRHTVIYGGVSQHGQTTALRAGTDIVIATPGRLLDLMNQGLLHLNTVEFFVLDEVDRMLDMGFINDIKKIIARLPVKKQTLFFSATMPVEIKKLSDSLLKNPVIVQTAAVSTAAVTVKQFVYHVKSENKKALLSHLLGKEIKPHVLVFTRTKRGADKLAKSLNADGVKAEAIHGNKSQNTRQKALDRFKSRLITMLIATDVASRGLDITDISHVVNFDLPEEAETYIHRIGRTGRAGASGVAIAFCSPDERGQLRDINKLTQNMEVVELHPYDASRAAEEPRRKNGQQQRRSAPGRNSNNTPSGGGNSHWKKRRTNDRSYR